MLLILVCFDQGVNEGHIEDRAGQGGTNHLIHRSPELEETLVWIMRPIPYLIWLRSCSWIIFVHEGAFSPDMLCALELLYLYRTRWNVTDQRMPFQSIVSFFYHENCTVQQKSAHLPSIRKSFHLLCGCDSFFLLSVRQALVYFVGSNVYDVAVVVVDACAHSNHSNFAKCFAHKKQHLACRSCIPLIFFALFIPTFT